MAKFKGTKTNYKLVGSAFADIISALTGNDLVRAGAGNDSIDGGFGMDTIYGGDDNDTLYGGADTLVDKLYGEDGDDTYVISDTKDIISDIEGNNILSLLSSFSVVGVNLSNYTNATIVQIIASVVKKGLVLKGNASDSTVINGGLGNDSIIGGDSGDELYGNKGNDTIYGGAGDDTINGGLGNDTYIFDGTEGTLTFSDSGGIDTVKFTSGLSSYSLDDLGYDFIEKIDVSGVSSTDIEVTGNDNNNLIIATSGNDTLIGLLGADSFVGGLGDDVYYINGSTDKVTETKNGGNDTIIMDGAYDSALTKSFNLATYVETLDMRNVDMSIFVDKVLSVASFAKAKFAVNGNASDNVIYTAEGTYLGDYFGDYIQTYGGLGNDTIYGSAANEYINGGLGDDYLDGGSGNDTIIGAAGADTLFFESNYGQDVVTGTDAFDTIRIAGVDRSDLMFFTDSKGALGIDYTSGGCGQDYMMIGKANNRTLIQLDDTSIYISALTQAISSTDMNLLTSSEIQDVFSSGWSAVESQQTTLLASAWT